MTGRDLRSPSGPGRDAMPPHRTVTPAEAAAIVVGVLWLAISGLYVLRLSGGGLDSLRLAISLLVIVLPLAMIWVAAATARSARIVRDESRRLQAEVEAMRQAYLQERQTRAAGTASPGEVERRLAVIERAARQAEQVLVAFATGAAPVAAPRDAGPPPIGSGSVDDQPRLALGGVPGEADAPLDRIDLIRALNFPETESDRAGFAALRQALADRSARVLIQASQDVLTLLSQDGIYMDDLRPDRARPEIWRRFAQGERGGAVAGLGGIRDKSVLALTAGRMREDAIFRDAAHHFLRLFDRMLHGFEPEASDEDLARLSETRTARAFMLFGRVAGSFD